MIPPALDPRFDERYSNANGSESTQVVPPGGPRPGGYPPPHPHGGYPPPPGGYPPPPGGYGGPPAPGAAPNWPSAEPPRYQQPGGYGGQPGGYQGQPGGYPGQQPGGYQGQPPYGGYPGYGGGPPPGQPGGPAPGQPGGFPPPGQPGPGGYGGGPYGQGQYGAPPQQQWGGPPPQPYGQYGAPPGYGGYGQHATVRTDYAEWGQRAIGGLIDYVAPIMGAVVLAVIFSNLMPAGLAGLLTTLAYLGALGFILWNSYRGGESGQTIGRRYAKVTLIKEETGQPVGGGMGILRYICHAIEFGIGWLAPLFTPKKQTFADMLLGTVVVRADD